MGVFDKYIGLRGRWPVRAIETLVVDSTRPVWSRVIGATLSADEIRQRELKLPVSKAEIGAVALQQGLENEDIHLQHIGAAMVVQAAADAAQKPHDLIVQSEVGEVVAGVPIGDVTLNPYLTQDLLARAAPILNLPEESSVSDE